MEEAGPSAQANVRLNSSALDDLLAPTERSLDGLLEESLEELGLDGLELTHSRNKQTLNNAERCRRHREKQRKQAKEIHVQNVRLKRERTDMLKTISDLQNEVQCLRGQGAINFALENALLRAEIKKHRLYIEAVVNLSRMGPVVPQVEENMRLMQSGVESGVGQVIGLMYSSINSDTWKEGVPVSINLDDSDNKTTEVPIQFWYQCLPLGATVESSHRFNLRVHLHNLPSCARSVIKLLKTMLMDTDLLKGHTKSMQPHVDLEELIPVQILEGGETLGCHKIKTTKDGIKREDVVAHAYKEVEMFPNAFPDDVNIKETRTLPVVVSSSCNFEAETGEDFQRVKEISSHGVVIVETGANETTIVSVLSIPRENGVFDFAVEPLVNEKGELAPMYVDRMQEQWKSMLSHAYALKNSQNDFFSNRR